MADQRPFEPHNSGSFSRALLVAVMVAVLFAAILVAVDGILSVILDRDVISETDAGPLVGPIMAFAAMSVVFVSVLSGLRPVPGGTQISVIRAIVTGGFVYVFGPAVGAIVYVFGREQTLSGSDFFLRYLSSPFVAASAVIAFVTVLCLPLISQARSRAR